MPPPLRADSRECLQMITLYRLLKHSLKLIHRQRPVRRCGLDEWLRVAQEVADNVSIALFPARLPPRLFAHILTLPRVRPTCVRGVKRRAAR